MLDAALHCLGENTPRQVCVQRRLVRLRWELEVLAVVCCAHNHPRVLLLRDTQERHETLVERVVAGAFHALGAAQRDVVVLFAVPHIKSLARVAGTQYMRSRCRHLLVAFPAAHSALPVCLLDDSLLDDLGGGLRGSVVRQSGIELRKEMDREKTEPSRNLSEVGACSQLVVALWHFLVSLDDRNGKSRSQLLVVLFLPLEILSHRKVQLFQRFGKWRTCFGNERFCRVDIFAQLREDGVEVVGVEDAGSSKLFLDRRRHSFVSFPALVHVHAKSRQPLHKEQSAHPCPSPSWPQSFSPLQHRCSSRREQFQRDSKTPAGRDPAVQPSLLVSVGQ
eukprot:Rhum_TRINITY_DN14824_c11_g1::Rhum_TRINITY_DN14824_c11_g1_i1::g.119457::m.119457